MSRLLRARRAAATPIQPVASNNTVTERCAGWNPRSHAASARKIALPSTAREGSCSRIVPVLERGAGVVTTRAQVDYVVTEYGSVCLRGRSLQERARALLGLVHPDFREALARGAREELGIAI